MERRTFSARLDCHYILDAPEIPSAESVLAVVLHGYGQNAEMMLHLTRGLLGPAHAIASIEAPHSFMLADRPKAGAQTGFNWGSQAHHAETVRLHHEMVLYVLDDAGRALGIMAFRRLLVGFSQPVGMNYRFVGTYPDAARGLIGICGGVPRGGKTGDYRPVTAALLHIARREDEYYPAPVAERFAARLRTRASDVEFHLLDGGHRFPSKAGPLVSRWIERVFGG